MTAAVFRQRPSPGSIAETGAADRLAASLEEWAKLILDDYDLHTGYRVAHHWQKQRGSLPFHGLSLLWRFDWVHGNSGNVGSIARFDGGNVADAKEPGEIAQSPAGERHLMRGERNLKTKLGHISPAVAEFRVRDSFQREVHPLPAGQARISSPQSLT